MKRAFFFFTIALCAISLKAQDSIVYRSIFGDSTTIWEGVGVSGGVDVMMMVSRADDTAVIEGQKYQLQRDDQYYVYHGYGPHQPYYVRESESRDKVYVRFCLADYNVPDTITTEMLVMDLSLNVGDTLNTQSWEQCTYLGAKPTPRIMVDSIFYLDGRKMMRTNCIAQHYYCAKIVSDTLYFIEGVGPSMGIAFPMHAKTAIYDANGITPRWDIGYSVRCHFSDSILDFHYINYYSTELECDYKKELMCSFYEHFENIQEGKEQQTEIYPNPAQDKITIDGTFSPQSRYRIVSIDGKTALDGTLSNGSNTITIADLRKGIYLISIEDNGNKTIKKIVKL